MAESNQALRVQVLGSCGATPEVVDELLAYGAPPAGRAAVPVPVLVIVLLRLVRPFKSTLLLTTVDESL